MKRRTKRILIALLLLLGILLLVARLYLNVWLLNYVNKVLDNIPGYQGSISGISIDLYRGAYKIHDLKLFKKNGNIPTPFIDIALIDLSLQWSALFHGRIVSDIDLQRPVLNFAISKSGNTKQTGKDVDWNKPIRDLMPIDINTVTFTDGKLTFKDFSSTPQVNLYIHQMHGEIKNLRNVVDKTKPLPSNLDIAGESIGQGRLHIKGNMNILKPVPDMDMDVKLENANLVAFNSYTSAYGAIDIKSGKLSVYSEFSIKNNHLKGYVKPLATGISLIDLRKPTNPLKLAWEVVVSTVVTIFTNHTNDQFATKIPLEGNLGNISTDTWTAVVNIVRNAFVQAFKKGVDGDVKF